MEKYIHYYSGFDSENAADNWGEEHEKGLMKFLGDRAPNFKSTIKTQPNSQTGLWTCTVTVENL